MAYTIAYAELVLLLRHAKAAGATFRTTPHIRKCFEQRIRYPLPRFDYTLRSDEYANAASTIARACPQQRIDRMDERLMTAIVGFKYATHAGDVDSHATCRDVAHKCWAELTGVVDHSTYPPQLFKVLPRILDTVSVPHDVLIDACLKAAQKHGEHTSDHLDYLGDALFLCGDPAACKKSPATNCRWIQQMAMVSTKFDPIEALAETRANHPSSLMPYITLNSIVANKVYGDYVAGSNESVRAGLVQREAELGFDAMSADLRDLWADLRASITERETLWLLVQIHRFKVPARECLETYQRRRDTDSRFMLAVAEVVANQLKDQAPASFATHLLHLESRFVFSHTLLDREPQECLSNMFSLVRSVV